MYCKKKPVMVGNCQITNVVRKFEKDFATWSKPDKRILLLHADLNIFSDSSIDYRNSINPWTDSRGNGYVQYTFSLSDITNMRVKFILSPNYNFFPSNKVNFFIKCHLVYAILISVSY